MRTVDSLGNLVARILENVRSGTLGAGFREPIRCGSAAGVVTVEEDLEGEGRLLLQVSLRVMEVPPEHESPLLRRLLELNGTFQGRAAFCVDDRDVVWLMAGRPLEDLDPSEIIDVVLWTAEQADRLDDVLLEEFGYGHEP